MADNDSSGSGSGDGGGDNEFLTLVALSISIVALVLSTLQALLAYLQFDNSEVGRRRCSPEVMGKEWAAITTSTYKWRDFRYQVFFEVPVFYTAPPGITVGPVTLAKPEVTFQNRLQRVLRGSETELEDYGTVEEEAVEKEVIDMHPHVAPIYKITGTPTSYKHTMVSYANRKDEKWANVHTTDDEGCSWVLLLDALQGQERISRAWDRGPKNRALDHSICYVIQRQRRCWDHMPLNATKPFAKTTICHLVEIMSMLGLIWSEFDVKGPVLNAEGNGHMVKSEYMSGLGILVRFSRLSRPVHEANRIIPCGEVKRLCFGDVPSLFDDMGQRLLVGPGRLEACLTHLLPDLAPEHRDLFLQPEKSIKTTMITPTFELIAMVAKSAHIPGSRFRRLPNPCADKPPSRLNAAACLSAFARALKGPTVLGTHVLTEEIKSSFERGRLDGIPSLDIVGGRTLEQLIDNFIIAQRSAEDERAERFFAPAGERDSRKEVAESRYNNALLHLLDALHSAVTAVDQRLRQPDLREEVRCVVASHFHEVFTQSDALQKTLLEGGQRERKLVGYYFDETYPKVVSGATDGSASSAASTLTGGGSEGEFTEAKMQRGAVWLALNFRLWAWLFLHEFDPADRMIERTEYLDSRLPIYIS